MGRLLGVVQSNEHSTAFERIEAITVGKIRDKAITKGTRKGFQKRSRRDCSWDKTGQRSKKAFRSFARTYDWNFVMSIQDELFDKLENSNWHGHYFSALCPFHDDDRASLLVWPDYFKCLACGAHGGLEYLKRHVDSGVQKSFSVKKPVVLPKWRSWQRRFGDLHGIASFAHSCLMRGDGKYYFKRRKIYQFAKQGMFGYLDGWYMFPIVDQHGSEIDIVVRACKGKHGAKYVLSSISDVKERPLYVPNWKRVLSAGKIYIPFGIVDAWAFEALLLPAVTGTTGKDVQEEQVLDVSPTAEFIIVPDRYEERAAWNLARSLGMRAKVKILDYPSDTKDPDEIRRKFGDKKLKDLLEDA